MTLLEAARALRERRVSAVELGEAALAAIERLNPKLNAFLLVTRERALERARLADRELAEGHDRGPLQGIPVALKDLFHMTGVATTGGSPLYAGLVPREDSTVVARLEAAGAVILGKLNLHELAYGITSDNPHFGAVRNPWNGAHSPGGSSGGSGAAVASEMVFAAMGTDTGGSIRIPASFCGTVGIKPTYGRVSRHGVLPLGYTLDHVGPLARTARDAAAVLHAIAGRDPKDDSSSARPVTEYVPAEGCSIRGVKIGVPNNFYFDRVQEDVEASVRKAIARAEGLGAEVLPVTVPDMAAVNAAARVILLGEASAVYHTEIAERRGEMGADVRALLDQGRLVAATDYINAQRLRRRMQAEFERLWDEVDCLMTPATPNAAPAIGETMLRFGGVEEDVRLASTRLVRGINLLGLPALSLPCGLTRTGLPVGLQVIGPRFAEGRILRIAAALEDSGLTLPECPCR